MHSDHRKPKLSAFLSAILSDERRGRWVSWISGLAIIAMLGWTFIFVKYVHPPGAPSPWQKRDPLEGLAIRLRNTELVLWNDCEKTWRFKADTINVQKDRQSATFDGPTRGEMLRDDKKVASVSTKKVTVDISRGVNAGNVSIPDVLDFKVVDGPSIRARSIYWNPRKSKVFCEGGVNAVLPIGTVQGDKVILDIPNKEITVLKIRGMIKLEEVAP